MNAVAKKKPSTFAARLRELREAAELTQVQLAKAAGVHIQTFMRWERGETEPTFTQLCAIASAVGKTLNDFTDTE
jgi:transcriptional regulator with XRE-family HTH domain